MNDTSREAVEALAKRLEKLCLHPPHVITDPLEDKAREAAATLRALMDRVEAAEAERDRLLEKIAALKNPQVRHCAKCGAPENNHPYRHPFVAVLQEKPNE